MNEGETAVFSVTASGDSLSYQWYCRITPEGSWKRVIAASGKTAEYSLTALERHNGYEYYCKVTDGAGLTAQSDPVSLTVLSGPVITDQSGSVTVNAGQTALFSVAASGDGLAYQWYYRTSPNGSWSAVSAASGKTANYSLTAKARHNGYEYFCRVTDAAGLTADSGIVSLTVLSGPSFTAQPHDVTVNVGETALFSVAVSGTDLTYQWYYLKPGAADWAPVTAESGKTADYSLTAKARHNGYEYFCRVTDAAGLTADSGIVSLTVG